LTSADKYYTQEKNTKDWIFIPWVIRFSLWEAVYRVSTRGRTSQLPHSRHVG